MEETEILGRVSLFSHLKSRDLKRIARLSRHCTYAKGEKIISEGEQGGSLFVIISGEVEGNVFAQERLEITANGKLMGDITAPRVSIAEGVLFEGQCTMKPPGQLKPPTPDAKEEGGAEPASTGRPPAAEEKHSI